LKKARKTRARKAAPARRPATPRVVIVGFGRVGGALALGLKDAGYDVTVLPRAADSVRKAASLKVFLADHDDLRAAHLCILAVPDAAVGPAVELVEEDLGPQTALVHCSGALPLTVFAHARTKRPVGSFHPLAAISDLKDPLGGHAVALAATDRALHAQLAQLAEALQMTPIEVPETGRAAYHAGAVLSAGLAVALIDGAVSALQEAGLDREVALKALLPLSQSALRGIGARGLERGLTGPVVRGDVSVVQAHLEALPPELGSLYRLLSRRALRLTPALPPETKLALERLLA
jgi:predicted short-subunit dehydrogenase-like oxidoreductase (DUF2520 family)